MIYQAYEMNRAASIQMRALAAIQGMLFRNSLNPLAHTFAGRSIVAACDVFEDLTRRYDKPAFGIDSTVCDGKNVAVHEEIAHRRPFGQLKHFVRQADRPDDPRLLIVAPLSGHFSTLLRDTVQALVPEQDVYVTDWRDARQVPLAAGRFGLDEYIDYLIDFMAYLGPNTHVLAVCQPAVPMLAATAIMAADGHPCTPRSLTLMGGPIDTRIDPTAPNKLATSHDLAWFSQHMIDTVPPPYPGALRRVYPGFLQLSGFITMNAERHLDAFKRLFHSIVDNDAANIDRHRRFYNDYLAVMDMPAAFYLDTIQRVFQEFHLARGCFTHHGRPVDLAAIKNTALFTIEGEKDDICSPGQTEAAQQLCPNIPAAKRRHHLQPDVGHYGVFSGRRWRSEIAPLLRDFIRNA
ncbi:MAG TPA: polyhydroxyalkanoate depolymerase [Salinisphaeraceae bacterium]|nr:polyhydroxyalkanoate depolymerase [Salinisphaeraceae bacterium]